MIYSVTEGASTTIMRSMALRDQAKLGALGDRIYVQFKGFDK